jgi:hypothetical protein
VLVVYQAFKLQDYYLLKSAEFCFENKFVLF